MYSFVVLGMFTSSIGVMLPHIEAFYELNDVQASACFLAGPTGYVIAAQFNHAIHHHYGRRGIAIIGPVAQLIAAAGTALHPPFLVLLACIALAFAGAGFLDGSWCTWAAGQKSPSFVSGLLHGSFSIGAGCGPMLIELVLSHGQPWYTWYKVLVSKLFISLPASTYAPSVEQSLTPTRPASAFLSC
jgi:fucose permease